jgi:hypothetical protein
MAAPPRPDRITKAYVQAVCERLAANKPVRRRLPQWGRIHIDRQLPFLCVYRRPSDPDPGTDGLVMGEASYLTASGAPELQRELASLVRGVAGTLGNVFGAFLVFEVWAARPAPDDPGAASTASRPAFRIFAPRTAELRSTLDVLERSLREAKIRRTAASVEAVERRAASARGLPELVGRKVLGGAPVHVIGLEIWPLYRSSATGEVYPLLQGTLHHELSRAIKRAFFEFTRARTTALPPH